MEVRLIDTSPQRRPGFCYDCGTPTPTDAAVCPNCGGWEVGSATAKVTRWPTAPGDPLPWPWSPLTWAPGSLMLLSGAPGSGKSSISALLRPALYITTEQSPAEAARAVRRIQGEGYNAPIVATAETVGDVGEQLEAHIFRRGSVVVVDSVTELGLEEAVQAIRVLRRWAEDGGMRVLVIAQRTKEGKTAGRQQLTHLVDVVAQVTADVFGLRRLDVQKNRAGDLFSAYFRLGDRGVEVPTWHQAYSVEGEPGAYQLIPYPTQGARWADPLTEGGPIEGRACAARRAREYASGWLVPEDVAQRRAFAELHGLTWLTPGGV